MLALARGVGRVSGLGRELDTAVLQVGQRACVLLVDASADSAGRKLIEVVVLCFREGRWAEDGDFPGLIERMPIEAPQPDPEPDTNDPALLWQSNTVSWTDGTGRWFSVFAARVSPEITAVTITPEGAEELTIAPARSGLIAGMASGPGTRPSYFVTAFEGECEAMRRHYKTPDS